MKVLTVAGTVLLLCLAISGTNAVQLGSAVATPDIPRTWDDEEIAKHEIPLADPTGSPKHVSSDYYYRIAVRPIYKGYPAYAPGREPAGYMEWLKQQEPMVVWDDRGHAPRLQSDADWIRAGEIVFDAPIGFSTARALAGVTDRPRDPAWYRKLGIPIAKDGTLPGQQYIVRTKGTVEPSGGSCASCHTRVMPDGSAIKGAQSNFPVQRVFADGLRERAAKAENREQFLSQLRAFMKSLYAAPWLQPDPVARIESMSVEEIASAFEAVPAGASLRQRLSPFVAVTVPDLIGVKDRRYLDRSGLEIHRSIGDLMRYAAMNQGGDSLASFAGFVPADAPRFRQATPPEAASRYSDEQLYALARYLYSLQPPPNPNRVDAVAAHGKDVFERERCGSCHTPPLYTNNKLTPAVAFEIPVDHLTTYDILRTSVGTDPELTTRTRRGTGYYKVPSLKGVWYRSMFGHGGWCATLEDWFDPRRTRDDYVPTGFKPYDRPAFAVKGHVYGLDLSETDRRALIAFLRTL